MRANVVVYTDAGQITDTLLLRAGREVSVADGFHVLTLPRPQPVNPEHQYVLFDALVDRPDTVSLEATTSIGDLVSILEHLDSANHEFRVKGDITPKEQVVSAIETILQPVGQCRLSITGEFPKRTNHTEMVL